MTSEQENQGSRRAIRALKRNQLAPNRGLVAVTPAGVTELATTDIDSRVIGAKAVGLLTLPPDWTLPFFVVTAEALSHIIDRSGFKQLLGLAAVRAGVDSRRVMVRSNGAQEGLAQRGSLISMASEWDDVDSKLLALNDEARKVTTGPTHWIIQSESRVSSKGFLSNERRLRRETRDWIIEVEEIDGRNAEQYPIGVRKWRSGQVVSTQPLVCDSPLKISLNLRQVALWAGQDPGRFLFEWVWDGGRVFIMQMDPAVLEVGEDPKSLLPSTIATVDVGPLNYFHVADAGEKTALKKLANAALYASLGYQMPPFYALSLSNELILQLKDGAVPTALLEDLRKLTVRPLVLRTDGSAIPPEKREMLPRSEELRSAEDAVGWLVGEFWSTIREVGLENSPLTLVGHHFIPSVASAWAGAEPGRRWVRIEALWGIPESLYWYTHDTFEVDVEGIDFAAPFTDVRDFPIRKKERYKGTFIAPDSNGRWIQHRTKPPADWGPTISSAPWLREIAYTTRRICQHIGKPVEVMWFVDNHQDATTHPVLPWYHSVPENLDAPISAPRKKIKTSRDSVVRDRASWQALQDAVRAGERIERVTVEPQDPELVRNPKFATELGSLAKENGFVIVLAGGILSHAYHALRRAGASVECIDLFGAAEEKAEYNKLVRDKVPEQIADRGEHYESVRLQGDALILALRRKLVEEAIEALDAGSGAEILGELADVIEVVHSLTNAMQSSLQELEDERVRKSEKRGGFDQGYMLLTTASPRTIPRVDASPSLLVPTGAEPKIISDPSQLPQKAVYKRPDHRTLTDSTEELLVIETELNSLGTVIESISFDLPPDVDPRQYTSSVELSRSGADLRAAVRLRLKKAEQLTLDLPKAEQ